MIFAVICVFVYMIGAVATALLLNKYEVMHKAIGTDNDGDSECITLACVFTVLLWVCALFYYIGKFIGIKLLTQFK